MANYLKILQMRQAYRLQRYRMLLIIHVLSVLNYVNELKKRLQMQKLLQILW